MTSNEDAKIKATQNFEKPSENTQPTSAKQTDELTPCLSKPDAGNQDYSTSISIEITDKTTPFDLWKGIFFMFLSCLCKSSFSILTKICLKDKKDLSSFQLLSYRTYFMLWITIIIATLIPDAVFNEKFVKKENIPKVIWRTFLAITSMSLVVFTIKNMHISDVYSVYYIYPGIILLLSLKFLPNEKFKCFDYICLVACFVGATLVVKPEFIFHQKKERSEAFFFTLVLLAAFLKAAEDVIVRDVGSGAHPIVFPFVYSIFGMVFFPFSMYLFDTKYPTFTIAEVIVIFFIGLSTYLYQFFMALGLQNEAAGRVSMVNYIQVALMYVTDLFLFDKSLQIFDLIGTMMIFGFNFTNGLLKTIKRLNQLNKQTQAQSNK